MRIKSVEIKNYKCFEHLKFEFENLSVFVGENNSGKSAIFAAIDCFFSSSNKNTTINEDDFYIDEKGDKKTELFIAITFSQLSTKATDTFSEYTSTDEVTFKLKSTRAGSALRTVIVGIRSGMEELSDAFAKSKVTPIADFNEEYKRLHEKFSELPPSTEVKSKDAKLLALREFETSKTDQCIFIESGDQAYGTVGPVPNIRQFIKWVFIPAVKDASDESAEGRNILSDLVSFAARKKTNFDERIAQIQASVSDELTALQIDQQSALETITTELNKNFSQISMGTEKIELNWEHGSKDFKVDPPKAAAKIISGEHVGHVGLFGHGLQRNYLVSLFKVLNDLQQDEGDDFTLIVAFEEPELYQHPPQAKLMARYLYELSQTEQIMLTTHSALFIHPDFFGKLHRVENRAGKTQIISVTLEAFTLRMTKLMKLGKESIESTVASLYTLISLSIAEVFFSRFVVLVEGLEDVGYLEAVIDATGRRSEVFELGINVVPVFGKNDLIPTIELCRVFKIPHFIVVDCDNRQKNLPKEKKVGTVKTNTRLFEQLSITHDKGFLDDCLTGENFQVWGDDIRTTMLKEYPEFQSCLDEANEIYRTNNKNPKLVYHACLKGLQSGKMKSLEALLDNILVAARK